MIRTLIIILASLVLVGCVDPKTNRDIFGNVNPGNYSIAQQIGENKFITEAVFQKDVIRGAQEACSKFNKRADITSINPPNNQGRMTAIFGCY
jgi:hypothetical protein